MIDALASIPFLSFLLIPTMTSYSTSLNLLFFYLTWSTLVLSHPPLRVEFVGTLAIRVLFYLLPSTFFLVFDALIPSAAESFKALGPAGLPFKNASRKRALRLLRVLGWSLFNVVFGVVLQCSIEVFLTTILGVRSALRVSTSLPMPLGILKDLVRGYVLRETLTYVLHRYVLHESSFLVADAHDDWYHSLIAPFPLAATYDHPAAYLIRSFIPTYLPALLFRFHLLTYLVYLMIASIEETFAYSGYSTVPTNFILGGIARRTDNHVLCGGRGNFGGWGLIDWLMGTTVGADLIDDVEAEADKHDIPEKIEKAKKKAGDGVRKRGNRILNGNKDSGEERRRRRRSDD